MKVALTIAPMLLLLLALPASVAQSVLLAWDYPSNKLAEDLTFKVYASPDVDAPLATWPVITNVVGTSTVAQVAMAPAQRFFFVTASNFWGESMPSNVANTPHPATNVANLKIHRP